MAHAFAPVTVSAQPEYSVYIYHRLENQHEGQNDWEMRTITPDLNVAMDEAQTLHQSESFRKVEVKQRIFDRKTEQIRDQTLRVFAHKKRSITPRFLFLSIGFVFCGGAVLAGILSV